MLAYMTANEAAEKWNISHRRVLTLCQENRIKDIAMLGNMWLIPITATKPEDARTTRHLKLESDVAKPFLKWAGGKGQLLKEIGKFYPFHFKDITKYAEPFVGGGAVLFDILNKFDLQEVYISDTNIELMHTYKIVRDDADNLIERLFSLQNIFIPMDEDSRKEYYYQQRERFNKLKTEKIFDLEIAVLMIFLNKTCFNGLYRVNKKGEFNVPMGSYKKPLICDEINIKAVSEKLQKVKIVCGDFKECVDFVDEKTFVYFDPPYRPLNKTSGFTAYTENEFSDIQQAELCDFIKEIDRKGAKFLLSNSDPKNENDNDHFFDDLYSEFNITRVDAVRMINSNSAKRGKIKELMISNF